MNLSITKDIIDKFKCTSLFCNNYLSHFPIYTTRKDENVCGRCWPSEQRAACHNEVFEELAQHIKFPCRYEEQGCIEELFPKDVPSHEKNCHFKSIECPGLEFLSCSWQGDQSTMLSHCREYHEDVFLENNTFELSLKEKVEMDKFLEFDGMLFLAHIELCGLDDDSVFNTLIYQIHQHRVEDESDVKKYSCKILLSRARTNVCIEESVEKSLSDNKWGKIALDSLIRDSIDERRPIVVKIIFEKDTDDYLIPVKRFKSDLLTTLKCSECGVYVLPPIHQFEDNRIKCDRCGPEVGSRNFNLDRIAEKLYYPCRYEKNGCDIVLKSEEMKKHMLTCPFEDHLCPFCRWSGLIKDFRNHILERHGDKIVESGEEISAEVFSGKMCMIRYAGRLFELKFSVGLDYYKWVVNSIGHVEGNFGYEIEMTDVTGNNCLFLQRKCKNRKRDEVKVEMEADEETFCTVGKNNEILQWQDLDKINFKIRISE